MLLQYIGVEYHVCLESSLAKGTGPVWQTIIIIIIIIILYLYYRLLSQAFPSRHFSWTSGDPHRSGFKFHTAVHSVLYVIFQV
jgi:hypothetical protein